MSDELKKCPFCMNMVGKCFEPTEGDYYGCPDHTNMMMTIEQWQSRPIEDALQAKLDEACQGLVDIYVADGGLGMSEYAEDTLKKIGMEHKLDGLRT